VDFVAILPALPDSVYTDAYSLVRQAGTMVPMFSLTDNLSTISGIATVETDLTNDAPEAAADVKIVATIDVDNPSFIYKYIQMPYYDVYECDYCGYWSFDYYALIRQIAFHSTVFEATTAADGSFSLQVPSTPDGLPFVLCADEFATNQSLLQATLNSAPVWGVQTVRTMFGPPSAMTYSTIATNVQSAYVTFSAPTGTPDAQPTTEAEAYAVLTSSGIVSINMIYQGEGYTQAPRVYIAPGSGYTDVPLVTISGGGTGASATPVRGFPVTDISLNAPGVGFDDVTSIFLDDGTVSAEFYGDCDVKFDMGVRKVTLNDGGYFFDAAPTVAFTPVDGNGSGAAATALITWEIMDLVVDNQGSGYISDDANDVTVLIDPPAGAGVQAEASPVLGNGVLSGVEIYDHGQGYTAPPNVFIMEESEGDIIPTVTSAAQLSATVSNGQVTGLTITDPGSGYYVTPNVNITVPYSLMTAVGRCTVESDGRIKGVEFTGGYPFTQGFGYDTPPTLTFTASIPGKGSGAEGVAVVNEGRVTNVIMTNHGSGYIGKNNPYTAKASAFLPSASVMATAGKAYIRDINFGTGKRTIEQ